MTYKWIGAVLVIVGCGGFGFAMASAHRQEERRLGQLLRALQYMQCELQYHLTPLPELCRQAGAEASGDIGQVLRRLAQELETQTFPDAASCMRAAIGKSPDLSPGCRRLLVQLGRSLGRFDLSGQLQGLQAVKAACREQRRRLEKDREIRLRSYRTLGLCAGAALAILFV